MVQLGSSRSYEQHDNEGSISVHTGVYMCNTVCSVVKGGFGREGGGREGERERGGGRVGGREREGERGGDGGGRDIYMYT